MVRARQPGERSGEEVKITIDVCDECSSPEDAETDLTLFGSDGACGHVACSRCIAKGVRFGGFEWSRVAALPTKKCPMCQRKEGNPA